MLAEVFWRTKIGMDLVKIPGAEERLSQCEWLRNQEERENGKQSSRSRMMLMMHACIPRTTFRLRSSNCTHCRQRSMVMVLLVVIHRHPVTFFRAQ